LIEIEFMRILLTGATGFLGSALAHHWVAVGHELCLLIRHSSNTNRVKSLLDSVRIERVVNADLSIGIVSEFRPDAIVHTACAYEKSGNSLLDLLDANLRMGLALLQATITQDNGNVVFINTNTVLEPDVNLYALSKSQFSQWAAIIASRRPERLKFINLRLQQIYGPGDDRSKFPTYVIEACRLKEESIALTSGEQRRDFIYIDDTVKAYDTILNHHREIVSNESIDIGSGVPVSISEFVKLVHKLTNTTTRLDFGSLPYRVNEPMLCVADISRLSTLGWLPGFDLESGIRETLAKNAKTTIYNFR
jgi:CDP-paratose synthetase